MDKKKIVLETLSQGERCSVSELAGLCGVSLPTMRKLLVQMEQENAIHFHRGWANSKSKSRKEILNEFLANHYEQKKAIGRLAASLVNDHDTIFLGGGSTVSFMVDFLAHNQNLTIITNSIFTIHAALEYPQINLMCTGGIWSEGSLSFLGNIHRQLSHVDPDKIFLSSVAIALESGLSQRRPNDPNDEYQIKTERGRIFYLIDSSKFGQSFSWRITPAVSVERIITDDKFPAEQIPLWESRGIRVQIAPK